MQWPLKDIAVCGKAASQGEDFGELQKQGGTCCSSFYYSTLWRNVKRRAIPEKQGYVWRGYTAYFNTRWRIVRFLCYPIHGELLCGGWFGGTAILPHEFSFSLFSCYLCIIAQQRRKCDLFRRMWHIPRFVPPIQNWRKGLWNGGNDAMLWS